MRARSVAASILAAPASGADYFCPALPIIFSLAHNKLMSDNERIPQLFPKLRAPDESLKT